MEEHVAGKAPDATGPIYYGMEITKENDSDGFKCIELGPNEYEGKIPDILSLLGRAKKVGEF